EAARSKGEKYDEVNLCKVSVPGTNYFCAGNLGVPRVQMPQLSAKVADIPDKAAAHDLPQNARGEVELIHPFADYLRNQGVKITETSRPAGELRATQSELQASKIDKLREPVAEGKIPGAIFTSSDGYVLDGHHRWAAMVENDIAAGKS